MLIGMDVICKGDFAITNFQGNTTFSFRMPSMYEIDFVAEGNFRDVSNTNALFYWYRLAFAVIARFIAI